MCSPAKALAISDEARRRVLSSTQIIEERHCT
jgi:hypothetical protein